jgi:hypothetical protein
VPPSPAASPAAPCALAGDRAEITDLVNRYFSAIDDKRLDRAAVERTSPQTAA